LTSLAPLDSGIAYPIGTPSAGASVVIVPVTPLGWSGVQRNPIVDQVAGSFACPATRPEGLIL